MTFEQIMLWPDESLGAARHQRPLKTYSDVLTADYNQKGVLDVDTVKGCTEGMKARNGTGCYEGCYAANIARFRGIDFSKSVVRKVHNGAQARSIEGMVRNSVNGFFRIGTMGDPSHAWEETVATVEWLSPLAVPVIITKHWFTASDSQVGRLISCGAVLNTSISGLDTAAELSHREAQIDRYASMGGVSIARIISCEFNRDHPEGKRMAEIQDRLKLRKNVLDNPLRIPRTHHLFRDGLVRLKEIKDLSSVRPISVENPTETYIGHCAACPDKCGLASCKPDHVRPDTSQPSLF